MVLGKVNSHEARNKLTANANLPEHLLALKINSLIYFFYKPYLIQRPCVTLLLASHCWPACKREV